MRLYYVQPSKIKIVTIKQKILIFSKIKKPFSFDQIPQIWLCLDISHIHHFVSSISLSSIVPSSTRIFSNKNLVQKILILGLDIVLWMELTAGGKAEI